MGNEQLPTAKVPTIVIDSTTEWHFQGQINTLFCQQLGTKGNMAAVSNTGTGLVTGSGEVAASRDLDMMVDGSGDGTAGENFSGRDYAASIRSWRSFPAQTTRDQGSAAFSASWSRTEHLMSADGTRRIPVTGTWNARSLTENRPSHLGAEAFEHTAPGALLPKKAVDGSTSTFVDKKLGLERAWPIPNYAGHVPSTYTLLKANWTHALRPAASDHFGFPE